MHNKRAPTLRIAPRLHSDWRHAGRCRSAAGTPALGARRWSRAYGALLNVENLDIFAIAVGGRLSYLFRENGATTMSVSAFYAPDIITFGNADNVVDVSIRFETQLTPATRIFLGYRSFEFDLLDAKRKIDDDVHIGFRRRF